MMSDELNNVLETKTESPKSGSDYIPGSVENSLSAWGWGFLVLGIFSGLICIFAAGVVTKKYSFDSWGEQGVAWYLIIVGVAAILQGMFVRVLLEAGAEIIRLLRKLNNK